MNEKTAPQRRPDAREQAELRAYRAAVRSVVRAAEMKFRNAYADGKTGWDDPLGWQVPEIEPLNRAKIEIGEALGAEGAARLLELGDAMNFIVFDYAVNVRPKL